MVNKQIVYSANVLCQTTCIGVYVLNLIPSVQCNKFVVDTFNRINFDEDKKHYNQLISAVAAILFITILVVSFTYYF